MKIACPRGNVNGSHPLAHDMTAGEVERLVYALTAGMADAETEVDRGPDVGRYPFEVMVCPVEYQRVARDPEMYAEHIEQMVEMRRDAPSPTS